MIPQVKMGEFGLLDVAIVVGSKIIGERLFAATPVGDGTVISGAVKGVASIGLTMMGGGNKYLRLIGTGIAVDAAEDILLSVNPLGLFSKPAPQGEANERVLI